MAITVEDTPDNNIPLQETALLRTITHNNRRMVVSKIIQATTRTNTTLRIILDSSRRMHPLLDLLEVSQCPHPQHITRGLLATQEKPEGPPPRGPLYQMGNLDNTYYR
jgi:hypothetical protein